MFVTKRDGSLQEFDSQKIYNAIEKAFIEVNYPIDEDSINDVIEDLHLVDNIHVEEIQDQVEHILMLYDFYEVAKAYIIYRANREVARQSDIRKTFMGIINAENNDVTRENANMNSDSPAGMMMKFASETTKPFTDKYILSKKVKRAVEDNIIHIHDKDYYLTKSLTCLQSPLDKILANGFKSGHGESRGAKRIETAATLACISMETTQNEQHGGQAIPAFDFYLAPYVRKTFEEEYTRIAKFVGLEVDNIPEMVEDYIPSLFDEDTTEERVFKQAIENTVRRTHQAMEGFIHNMNQIHSRGGNQVVFSSINYGTDTSPEGRLVIRELLTSTEEGVGNGATAIFPIQIFKVKDGVSHNPEDPNYDLYKFACKVSAKRFFPNFLNLDATFNQSDEWNAKDPMRYMHEVATMGCRTRVFENRFGPKTSVGRGNLSFTTINLPKIAIETVLDFGGQIVDNKLILPKDIPNDNLVDIFFDRVLNTVDIVATQLDERFQFQKTALKKQFPFLMNGLWINSEKLDFNDTIESVINQGTLGIGFIGLAEALVALTGKHHGESDDSQKIGLYLIGTMKQRADYWSNELQHNYSILATPAEGLSGKFTKKDQNEFGKLVGITDRDYYTNSNHVPVYYSCSAQHKAEIECPYHELTLGGHIFYVEVDGDTTRNPEALMDIVNSAIAKNGGYISINHFQGRCTHDNFETADKNVHSCPICGEPLDILQRITG